MIMDLMFMKHLLWLAKLLDILRSEKFTPVYWTTFEINYFRYCFAKVNEFVFL